MDEAAARAIRRRRSVIDVKLEAANSAEFITAIKSLKRAVGGIDEDWGRLFRAFPTEKEGTEEEDSRQFLPLKPGWWERFLTDDTDPDYLMAHARKKMKHRDISLVLEDDERLLLECNASLPGSKSEKCCHQPFHFPKHLFRDNISIRADKHALHATCQRRSECARVQGSTASIER